MVFAVQVCGMRVGFALPLFCLVLYVLSYKMSKIEGPEQVFSSGLEDLNKKNTRPEYSGLEDLNIQVSKT